MIGDGIAHGIIVKVAESRGDPGASRMMFLVYDIGHVWSLKIMKDENSYTHQTLGFVWEAI